MSKSNIVGITDFGLMSDFVTVSSILYYSILYHTYLL